MYEIEIKINFRAGHRLLNYEGKCKNLHGEGYTAILIFKDKVLQNNDIMLDFGIVKRYVKNWINENWDHRVLLNKKDELITILKQQNQKIYELPFNPTAERMAEYLYNIINNKYNALYKVGIIESFNDSIAWYIGDDKK